MPISGNKIVSGSIPYTKLRGNTIQLEVPVVFFAGEKSIAIDSTGTKLSTARYLVSNELIKHLKEAYIEAAITDFGATDSNVSVVLRNATDSEDVASISITNDTYRARSSDISSDIKGLVGKEINFNVNVAAASATSGATATVRMIRLVLVLGIS